MYAYAVTVAETERTCPALVPGCYQLSRIMWKATKEEKENATLQAQSCYLLWLLTDPLV